ncbi:MAG: nucleotide-binding domain containing protein, partial [Hungatella sp.]
VEEIAEKLYHENQLHLLAGCAGFAAVLPKLLSLNGGKPKMPEFSAKFLVVCGSVNPITQAQLNYAEEHGFVRIRFTPEQKLLEGYFETVQGCETLRCWNEICQHHARCILDTNDSQEQPDTPEYAKTAGILPEEMRMRISTNLGSAIKKLIKMGVDSTLLITGGDSLLAFMNQIAVYEIIPICELAPGAVLSRFQIEGKTYEVISKSGGFGDENLMELLADEILEKKRR